MRAFRHRCRNLFGLVRSLLPRGGQPIVEPQPRGFVLHIARILVILLFKADAAQVHVVHAHRIAPDEEVHVHAAVVFVVVKPDG